MRAAARLGYIDHKFFVAARAQAKWKDSDVSIVLLGLTNHASCVTHTAICEKENTLLLSWLICLVLLSSSKRAQDVRHSVVSRESWNLINGHVSCLITVLLDRWVCTESLKLWTSEAYHAKATCIGQRSHEKRQSISREANSVATSHGARAIDNEDKVVVWTIADHLGLGSLILADLEQILRRHWLKRGTMETAHANCWLSGLSA